MFTGNRHTPLPEWVIPMCYAASAVPAGMVLPRLEHRFLAATSSVSSAVAQGLGVTRARRQTPPMSALTVGRTHSDAHRAKEVAVPPSSRLSTYNRRRRPRKYVDGAESSSKALIDGWYHTAERASVDGDGFLGSRGLRRNRLKSGRLGLRNGRQTKIDAPSESLNCVVMRPVGPEESSSNIPGQRPYPAASVSASGAAPTALAIVNLHGRRYLRQLRLTWRLPAREFEGRVAAAVGETLGG
jgi:hypothetical protein